MGSGWRNEWSLLMAEMRAASVHFLSSGSCVKGDAGEFVDVAKRGLWFCLLVTRRRLLEEGVGDVSCGAGVEWVERRVDTNAGVNLFIMNLC